MEGRRTRRGTPWLQLSALSLANISGALLYQTKRDGEGLG